ncbi:unnamed protein product [Soboliphyme baturini]|uniref:Uncharacterized protein n=1 Tax=Soboliphyme baturini TaxID=241478 RepID=A0A183IJI0_9BILA|nr:unnamed protein product [Soboliphyme baturini]
MPHHQIYSIVPSFDAGSDHLLVRARLTFREKVGRKALQRADHRQQQKVLVEAVLQARISSEDCRQNDNRQDDYGNLAEKPRCCVKSASSSIRERERERRKDVIRDKDLVDETEEDEKRWDRHGVVLCF